MMWRGNDGETVHTEDSNQHEPDETGEHKGSFETLSLSKINDGNKETEEGTYFSAFVKCSRDYEGGKGSDVRFNIRKSNICQ